MNAVEFRATVHNGAIKLPDDQKSWDGRKIRVILIDEANLDTEGLSVNKSAANVDFFGYAGLWENRDIDQESIRAKAWRNNPG
jgi:hypothetical protein